MIFDKGDFLSYITGVGDDDMICIALPLIGLVVQTWERLDGMFSAFPAKPESANLVVFDCRGNTFFREKVPVYHKGDDNPLRGKGGYAIIEGEWV